MPHHGAMVIRTTVRVPERVWLLLRRLSERQAIESGGRPSISTTVARLVEEAAARKAEEPRHVDE